MAINTELMLLALASMLLEPFVIVQIVISSMSDHKK
jgi:hypothetical protein